MAKSKKGKKVKLNIKAEAEKYSFIDDFPEPNHVYLKINRLAQQQRLTLSQFLDKLEKEYSIDTSAYPRDKHGTFKYPDGMCGLDIELEPKLEAYCYEAAERDNLSFDAFIEIVLREYLDKIEAKKK